MMSHRLSTSETENLRSVRVGLALSGGVARGPAHIGVLRELELAGVEISCVAGTSAGAIVGSAYAAGMRVYELEDMAIASGWRQVLTLAWPRHGWVSFARLEPWLEAQLGCLDLRDLALPFAAVATDLETGERHIFREGPLAKIVHASCAVPGFVCPVEINGRLYCDGGISDNLPVDAVKALGADYVIGVDLFVPGDAQRWGPLGPGAAAIETLVRQAGGGTRDADQLITPDISGFSYFRFSQARDYVARGAAAARTALPQILADLEALRAARQGQAVNGRTAVAVEP